MEALLEPCTSGDYSADAGENPGEARAIDAFAGLWSTVDLAWRWSVLCIPTIRNVKGGSHAS